MSDATLEQHIFLISQLRLGSDEKMRGRDKTD